jgi:hypothetical protein
MSDPSSGANEGPIILKVGFEFDDSLGAIIAQARDLFSKRLKEHADLSLKDVKDAAEELIGVTGKIEHIAKVIFTISEATEQMKKVTKDITIIERALKYTEQVALAAKTVVEPAPKPFTGVPSPIDYSGLVGATRFISKEEGMGEKSIMERLRSKARSFLGIEEVVKESKEKKEEKEITPETPQGIPLTPREEVERLAKKKKRQQKIAAKSPVTMEDLSAAAMIEFARIEEPIATQKKQELFEKETTLGYVAKRGGSEVGEYTPVFEEMGVSGEWEPARFRGQASLAVGASNVKKFIKERILKGLELSSSALAALTPEERELYEDARTEVKDNLLLLGSSLYAITGGADVETGGFGVDVIAKTDATPFNIESMLNLTGGIETLMDASRKSRDSGFVKFRDEVIRASADKQDSDDEAYKTQVRALHLAEEEKRATTITAGGAFIQETLADDVEPPEDPSVKFMRTALARKDLVYGKKLRTAMEGFMKKKLLPLKGDPSGVSEGLRDVGYGTPEGFSKIMDVVMSTIFEDLEKVEQEPSTSQADPGTIFGPRLETEILGNVRRFKMHKGSLSYQRLQEKEERARVVLSGTEKFLQQELERDPTLAATIGSMGETERTTPHMLMKGGEKSYLDAGVGMVARDRTPGIGDENIRRIINFLSKMPVSEDVEGMKDEHFFSRIETIVQNGFDGFIRTLIEQFPSGSEIGDVLSEINRG